MLMTIYLLCLLYLRYYKIMKNGMNLVPVVIYYTLCVKCFMIFKSTTYAICPCKGGCFFTCKGMCTGTCSGSCAGQSWKYGQ